MATLIGAECINCSACEPECPNNAIFEGGQEWEMRGELHPTLNQETFP